MQSNIKRFRGEETHGSGVFSDRPILRHAPGPWTDKLAGSCRTARYRLSGGMALSGAANGANEILGQVLQSYIKDLSLPAARLPRLRDWFSPVIYFAARPKSGRPSERHGTSRVHTRHFVQANGRDCGAGTFPLLSRTNISS